IFAHEFFQRYIEGHDVADYARLLERAGLVLRKRNPGRAWIGDVRIESRGAAVRIANLVAPTWPLYTAGVDQDDEIQEMDGQRVRAEGDVAAIVGRHRPGDRVGLTFADRDGRARNATITFGEDPHLDVVPVEAAGGTLTSAQRSFRDAWLRSKS